MTYTPLAEYPPLTAADFEMKYDSTHTYPFYEDENGDGLYAYGTIDDEEFARLAREYEIHVGAYTPDEVDPYEASDVCHCWAIVIDPDEGVFTWAGVTKDTPSAFPVSVIWR